MKHKREVIDRMSGRNARGKNILGRRNACVLKLQRPVLSPKDGRPDPPSVTGSQSMEGSIVGRGHLLVPGCSAWK